MGSGFLASWRFGLISPSRTRERGARVDAVVFSKT